MQLNEKQVDVIHNGYGRCLVIASAGSGKSTVLTKRIEFLLGSGENLESILAITFTNKAANDLKRKIESDIKFDSKFLNTGTFHSTCAKILREHGHIIGLRTDFTIADEEDSFAIMKKTVIDIEGAVPDDRIKQALHVTSYFINNDRKFEEIFCAFILFPTETHKTFRLVTDQRRLLSRATAPAEIEIVSTFYNVVCKPF